MNNKIPPPIVTLTFGLLIYFTKSLFPAFTNGLLSILSLLSLLIGLSILISAVSSFKKQQTTVNPISIEKASSLVVTGIFKYSRNPMYLGMVLILLSISFKFNLIGGIALTMLFAGYITKFQIIPEEIVMNKLFGDEFEKYKNKTRRWI
ncbi:MAG: isoprenylcysteine carboxylmethyltransferase family protein [SAR86 cluster bacterium]|jgi:protein-S-isoprenylcysteine O-methyltransferase Ste14|uniref:Isoprenylcysteine carboxylmethyltransferase family protein n=1 Tax=SAR86 cluster bacterium TaxID=2030880 RepID=A0A520N2A5_9GAMM|nr:MAG: isoprenylcysteine carboxylmethyltransferase family protein [SAR86 cluster bacterium]|tara:strand:- start:298 stop:744 length:447 start_codon:yes stop_codon:yes gene_type:complete